MLRSRVGSKRPNGGPQFSRSQLLRDGIHSSPHSTTRLQSSRTTASASAMPTIPLRRTILGFNCPRIKVGDFPSVPRSSSRLWPFRPNVYWLKKLRPNPESRDSKSASMYGTYRKQCSTALTTSSTVVRLQLGSRSIQIWSRQALRTFAWTISRLARGPRLGSKSRMMTLQLDSEKTLPTRNPRNEWMRPIGNSIAQPESVRARLGWVMSWLSGPGDLYSFKTL